MSSFWYWLRRPYFILKILQILFYKKALILSFRAYGKESAKVGLALQTFASCLRLEAKLRKQLLAKMQ